MKFRKLVLAAFICSVLIACYLGFADIQLPNDKLVHFVTFLVLTVLFYFIFDTNSLKTLRTLTFLICTVGASIMSEFAQHLVNPNRIFDINDIAFNFTGSLLGLVASQFYHKRLNEQKKLQRYEQLQTQEPQEDSSIPAQSEDFELSDLESSK